MKLQKPVHFWLIIIATAIFLWDVIFGYVPRGSGASIWAQNTRWLVCSVAYYLAFCMIVLAHAIASGRTPDSKD